jgi:hypothetical protein
MCLVLMAMYSIMWNNGMSIMSNNNNVANNSNNNSNENN